MTVTFHQQMLIVAALVAAGLSKPVYADPGSDIRILSSHPEAVTGGTTLVQLSTPDHSKWAVYLNNRAITESFHRSERSGQFVALLSGLVTGKNALEVRVGGTLRSKIQILNHPLTGPVFSGPRQQPFICQTEANGLGSSLDANCSARTVVQYYYKSTEPPSTSERSLLDAMSSATPVAVPPGFKPYNPSGPTPADIAKIVTTDGRTVDYIVRSEVGVINRAVYEIKFLHPPADPMPTPWTAPTSGWNGRLVYTFEGGCSAGYRQGVLRDGFGTDYEPILAEGYALATSSLNLFATTCDDKVSAETASMVKEHFIKEYGAPAYTIGTGGSGGAVSVYLVAQNYPGILDGIIPYLSAPDIITTVIPVFADCALLQRALERSQYLWTEAQKTAVSGYASWQTCPRAAQGLRQLGWLDPKQCDSSLPRQLIYDPRSNPKGTRCTFYDNAINVFGRDPKTGFARRTLDNVGIQYGLIAFNAGKIDADQFIELNARMGGFDQDGEIVPNRDIADPEGLRSAYEHGAAVIGTSLRNVPIIDWNRYLDDLGDIHTRDRAFLTRSRLIAANGNADNQVILVTPRPIYGDPPYVDTHAVPGVGLQVLVPQMDQWLSNIAADHTDASLSARIIRDKPAGLADGCVATDGERIAEPATYDGPGKCNQLYPNHGNPRVAAGAPIGGDILKCTLKPVDPTGYSQPLTPDQLSRLEAVFANGVCDYSKPGVGEEAQPIIWHAYDNERPRDTPPRQSANAVP